MHGHRSGAWLIRLGCGCVCLLGVFQPAMLRAATNTYLLNYANRSALLAGGWSFNATTNVVTQSIGGAIFSGAAQNTEITNTSIGGVISYAQTNQSLGTVTRIPCDVGTLWGSPMVWTNGTWPSLGAASSANQTRNSLFRSLPTNWVSMRLKCAFNPTQNYQGVSLLLYQDDDNYVDLAFRHNSDTANLFGLGGFTIAELAVEAYGFPVTTAAAYIPGTNVILRLDRDAATQVVSAFFSTNNGTSWVLVGQLSQAFTNVQLGIVVTGSASTFPLTNLPNCDLGEADILTSDTYTPTSVLAMEPQHLVFNAIQNQPCTVTQAVNVVLRPIELPVNWTVASNATWLSASVSSGQTPGACDVSVNTAGLTPGIYQGQLSFAATGPTNSPAAVNVTLIVNPNSPVRVSPWKDTRAGAMSVWVDDSDPTAFDDLSTNGLTGTYVMWHLQVPTFYASYYQAGMELGSHTVDHAGFPLSEPEARYQFESNILSLVTSSPVPQSQVISFAWPAGVTSPDEEAVAGDYFLVARGYNINQLEDPSPHDFMNLKSYNSHEHYPYPPADLKTVVDAAVAQGKWFNMVLHTTNNDNGAIVYSLGKNIWFATGGAVTKYIYQRDRVVITNYLQTTNFLQFNCYRLPLDPSSLRPFENAIGTNDTLTLTVNVNSAQVTSLLVNGVPTAFTNNGSVVYFDALITTNLQTVVLDLGSNSPPVLPAQANQTINELTALTVTNTASGTSGQIFTYALTVTNTVDGTVQANASIDTNGVISWTPTAAQSPGTYSFTTVAINNGAPPLSATNAFTVTVDEVNFPPTLPVLPNMTLVGQKAMVVTNTATESDPAATLGYQFTSAPAGASISANGIITWTPSPGQVPSTNAFTTVVTDTNLLAVNAQELSATNSFTVTVQSSPVSLPAQTNRTINELTLMLVTNTATVVTNLVGGGPLATNSILFNYPNRAALLADGWSFFAVNTNGTTRNTEITDTNVGVVSYAQTNGSLGTVLRVPCDLGDVWAAANNTRNALFHSLPANWVSLRLALAFAPTLDYQQAQLSLYQDDDNYVEIDRDHNTYNGVQSVELEREVHQAAVTLNYVNVTTSNLTLRLDRDAVSGNITGFYSLDGINWSSTGQTSQALTNTQVSIWTGASTVAYATTHLTCDFSRLDMVVSNTIAPVVYALAVTNTQDGTVVTNASIDSNGVISWTPTEAQGPGQYSFTTVATCGAYRGMNTFTVTVNEINTAPVLPLQTNRTLVGLQSLTVTNTASDSDIPINPLGYILNGPAGASISTNGIITWTPSIAQVPGVYPFTTVVTDTNIYAVNAQNLSATNTFTVTVQAIHNGPALPPQTNQVIDELTLLAVTNAAMDNDLPLLPLTYSLAVTNLADNSVVLNAAISTNGLITWTPSEAQGPGQYTFTTVVTDGMFSATNSFNVIVNEVNTPPVLPSQANQTIAGLQTLNVTNTATDSDIPVNPLGYVLTGPAGASISTNGIITWTPSIAQVPGVYPFTTVVTDTNIYAVNAQNLSATNTFTVTVQAIHNGPALPLQTNQVVNELTALTITNTAIDSDIPALPLTYSLLVTNCLDSTVVTNAAVDTNGVITWTPTESQGPGTNVFTTVVTDGSLSATNSFQVIVNEVNTAPTLPAQTNLVLNGPQTLIVTNTATDEDIPANPLGYQLSGPSGATIDANGVITWTPAVGQIPSTNIFITVVTDTNVYAVNAQSLSATNSFTVIVLYPVLTPVARDKSYYVNSGSTLVVAAPGVLADDDDPYGESLSALLVQGPTNGTLSLNHDGKFSYTPTNGFVGTDSFTYQAGDDFNNSTPATVAITVQQFQILSIGVANGVATLSWSSLPQGSYRLQSKANLTDTNWNDLAPDVLATGLVTSTTNILGNATQQFYRVLLLQ